MNTKAIRVRHDIGGDFRHTRRVKEETREQLTGTMHGKVNRGLDYTPLYKFLLSRAGQKWDDVFSEASARLDNTTPVFYMVALRAADRREIVRLGESSYYSGMYVDDDGLLQLVNPGLKAADMEPYCACCTHTFNGVLFGKKYGEEGE